MILISGGANGIDKKAATYAKIRGDSVKHYHFKRSKSNSNDDVYVLTETELKEADPYLDVVNKKYLNRNIKGMSDDGLNLLRRNYHIAKHSKELFAIGFLEFENNKAIIQGGTGWPVCLFVEMDKSPVNFYDQNRNIWYSINFDYKFIILNYVPKISEHKCDTYGVVGSRNPTVKGYKALEEIFNT